MTTTSPFTIIQATPGYRVIYGDDGKLHVDDEIIAWRIETEENNGQLSSSVFPLTPEGDPASNWQGILYPDGRVSMMDSTYPNLNSAAEAYSKR